MFVALLYSFSTSSVHLESSRDARYATDETKYKQSVHEKLTSPILKTLCFKRAKQTKSNILQSTPGQIRVVKHILFGAPVVFNL